MRAVRFREGDPGKHVHALVPTPVWKKLTDRASAEGVTIAHAAMLALAEWGEQGQPAQSNTLGRAP